MPVERTNEETQRRDAFAAAALQGMLAGGVKLILTLTKAGAGEEAMARTAYRMADAMRAASEGGEGYEKLKAAEAVSPLSKAAPDLLDVCEAIIADRVECGIDLEDEDDPLADIVRRAMKAVEKATGKIGGTE
jgi:hypothetical protein